MLQYLHRCAREWVLPTFFLCSCLCVCSVLAQTPSTIEWKVGRLSVLAERVPLAQIVREVAR